MGCFREPIAWQWVPDDGRATLDASTKAGPMPTMLIIAAHLPVSTGTRLAKFPGEPSAVLAPARTPGSRLKSSIGMCCGVPNPAQLA